MTAVVAVTQRRPRTRRRVVIGVLVALLVPTCWSYGRYLTAAGDAPVSVRSVDWLRDHGFEGVVNRVEQWWYTRSRPRGSTPNPHDLPTGVPATEGAWHDVPGLVAPVGTAQVTYVRPDPKYRSVVTDLVRLDQAHVSLVYVPGTREPGGTGFAWGSEIPAGHRRGLIAAFNGGFKFRNIEGGAYTEGRRLIRPLQSGSASLVIDRDGRADVVSWRRAFLTPDVVSVRQNLALVVDGGRPVPGLRVDRGRRWGTPKSQFQFTWRSGVGIDASGRLVFAAGRKMTLTDLARALVDAGAVRGMQLDIHDDTVTLNWFRPAPATPFGIAGAKLMASMERSANRYLVRDQRDFFAVEAR